MSRPLPSADELLDLSSRIWQASVDRLKPTDKSLVLELQKVFDHLEVKALIDNSLELRIPAMSAEIHRDAFADVINRGLAYVGIQLPKEAIRSDNDGHLVFTVPNTDIKSAVSEITEKGKPLKQGTPAAAVMFLLIKSTESKKDESVDLELPLAPSKPPAPKR